MTSYFQSIGASSSRSSTGTPSPVSTPLSPPASAAHRPNALSNRLTSVLSASYADSDIRDALETLGTRGIQNTPETRRQLRLDVQKEVIDCNAEIVRDFGKVAEQLKRIGSVISTLNRTCEEMRKHINLAKQDTVPVLEETSALMKQKEETEMKQLFLDAFTEHFIVPEEDLLVLTSPEEPINDRFFYVLARVKQVYRDCEVLLGGKSERLGLEIMEKNSRYLNSAYQKLYKWTQREFRSLNLEDPRISGSIRRALRVLAERPSLFHNCLDFFAEARDYVLSEAFHYALTQAASDVGGDQNVKPIEFSAHDPLRYIGDMLAWVHSTTVSEREALESLFIAEGDEIAKGIKAGLSSEPWSRIDEDNEEAASFDAQKALCDLVNRDLEGVSRSLQQRVELVIQGHEDPVTCYKVVNILSFYRATFSKLVGPGSNLAQLMQTLEKFTFGHFEILINDQTNMLSADHGALQPPEDLSAPKFMLDSLEVLTSLMKAHAASFGAEDDPSKTDDSENRFTPVLRVTLEPFLQLAKSSSEQLQDPTSRTIYQTNIFLTARSTISSFPFASATHLKPLSITLSTLRVDLLKIQHEYLLRMSGLQVLLEALEAFTKTKQFHSSEPEIKNEGKQPEPSSSQQQQPPNLADITSLPPFQPKALMLTSQQLDDFLPSALVDATDNLKRLQSASLVKSVTEEAVEAFCRDFEFIEGMIIGADEAKGKVDISIRSEVESQSVLSGGTGRHVEDEDSMDWSLRASFPRTTGEIRVLLS